MTKPSIDLSNVTVADILSGGNEADDQNDSTNESTDTGDNDGNSADDSANDTNDDDNTDDGNDNNDTQDSDTDDSAGDDQSSDEDEGESEDDGPSVVSELATLIGYEFEEGEEFPEDIQGIANFTKKAAAQLSDQNMSTLFEQYPDVEEYLKYRSEGGNPNQYFELARKMTDYDAITDDSIKGDVDLQKSVISDLYSRHGYSDTEIREIVKDLEDSELLQKTALSSGNKLKALTAQEREQDLANQAAKAAFDKEENVKTWQTISDTIATGNLKGFVVPEKEKKNFHNWMSKPVDAKGTTQRAVDMAQMDTESSLALEYLYYKKFDLGKIAQNHKSSSKASNIRSRISGGGKSASKIVKGQGGHKRSTQLPGVENFL